MMRLSAKTVKLVKKLQRKMFNVVFNEHVLGFMNYVETSTEFRVNFDWSNI